MTDDEPTMKPHQEEQMEEIVSEATGDVPQASPQGVASQLNRSVSTVITTVMRGIVAAAGPINAVAVLASIAYHTGKTCSLTMQGPLPELLKARKVIREAFDQGLTAGGINQDFGPGVRPPIPEFLKRKG